MCVARWGRYWLHMQCNYAGGVLTSMHIEHYAGAARKLDSMSQVSLIGIDEISLRKGQNCIPLCMS